MRAVVRRSIASAVALVLPVALGAAPAAGATVPATAGASIVVTTLVDVTDADGLCSLREAILAADLDGQIIPGAGECAGGSAEGTDVITFSVSGTIAVALENLPDIGDDTTIDGGGTVAVDGRPSFHGLAVQPGATATIRGLDLAGNGDYGGAVMNHGTLTLEDCTVHDSQAIQGGGLYTDGGATVVDSVFTGNVADQGGAIHERVGGIFVTGSTISGNTAAAGGGIYSGNDLLLVETVVSGNAATSVDLDPISGGGGIASLAVAVIDGSTIAGNQASAFGGGWLSMTTASMTRSTVMDNSAVAGGGIAMRSSLVLANSTVSGNTASSEGGGVLEMEAGAVLGAANSTIARNASPATPGVQVSHVRLQNTLVLGNAPESEPQVDGDLTFDSVAYLVAPPAGLTVDDILDPAGPGDHDGPTPTLLLVAGPNPAVGAGDAAICATAPVGGFDQRGRPRETPCDLGSVERDDTPPQLALGQVTLRTDASLAGTGAPASLAWAASDDGSGVDHVVLERRVNGGGWVAAGTASASPVAIVLPTSGTVAYRVAAVDADGNASDPVAGPVLTTRLVQQGASSVRYAGTWTNATSGKASGGSLVYAKRAGASARFTFTGRAVAFVTTRASSRGRVAVYIGKSKVATLDLGGSTSYRYVAWSREWATSAERTIRLVVLGTKGRPRIDVDAFVVSR